MCISHKKTRQVREELRKQRLKELLKILKVKESDIINLFWSDLLSLPYSSGSDEREYARDWLIRGCLVGPNNWEKAREYLSGLHVPTISEMKRM